MPSCAHTGAVAKSASALLLISAAHQRERASPVLLPQRFPLVEHSLSSASNSADMREGFPKAASTSIALPFTKAQPIWLAPPVPSVAPPSVKIIALTFPPVVPK